MDITPYLKEMVQTGASDLFFSVGAPVTIKVNGLMKPLGQNPVLPGEVKTTAYSLMDDPKIEEFEREMEMNMAVSITGLGRFRVNIYRQRGEVAMVVRFIKRDIPSIEDLKLPLILKELVMETRGLILLVGATGVGKSTTLASMIDHRNATLAGHILSIEDPIEYLHRHKLSIVDQREVGLDTRSYANALKNAMREAPDVIMIGEIRDRETMQHAIAYAETGHLCLSTLHANNSNQALERVINFFPEEAHQQLLYDLSLNLRAIISQRLIPDIDGGRAVAAEVMLNTPYVADLVAKGAVEEIKEVMKRSREVGMQTFDQALYDLCQQGRISQEQALKNADSRNNLALEMRLKDDTNPMNTSDLSIAPQQERGR